MRSKALTTRRFKRDEEESGNNAFQKRPTQIEILDREPMMTTSPMLNHPRRETQASVSRIRKVWITGAIGILVVPFMAMAMATYAAGPVPVATPVMVGVSTGASLLAFISAVYVAYASFRIGHRGNKLASAFVLMVTFVVCQTTVAGAMASFSVA